MAPSRAQEMTQSIRIYPGWNAVWLEVEPADNRADAVFAGLPVASVWTRSERVTSVDFIQDPSEAAFNEAGWLGWFAPSRPESIVKTLFAVQANRAYLLKSTNQNLVVWNVAGRPSLRRLDWVPDALNLRGLPVDPDTPPTFESFFAPSRAHYDASGGGMRAVYRLNPAGGQWELLGSGEPVESGMAYWIYTEGASEYVAPLSVRVDLGDGLDYGLSASELDLHLVNHRSAEVAGVLMESSDAPSSALAVHGFDPVAGGAWTVLPRPYAVGAAPGAEVRLRLALQRQRFSGGRYESVLRVEDGLGTRLNIPVAGERRESVGTGQPSLAGLWVGSASIDAVSEPHSASPSTPTPTRSPFNLRLLLHVAQNGQVRLLKEVTQMWRNGTYTNNAAGERVVERPGEYVLITDDALLPFFDGAALRDAQIVGRRLSSVGYDFDSGGTNNFVELSGTFALGGTLSGALVLPGNHPRNPFKHKYHPDHDNLTARFDGPADESVSPTRLLILTLTASPPSGPPVTDYGYNTIGGVYQEIISGLHSRELFVSGTLRLQRVSPATELNPSPAP